MFESTKFSSIFSISEAELTKKIADLLEQSKDHSSRSTFSNIQLIEKHFGAEKICDLIQKCIKPFPKEDENGTPYDPEYLSDIDISFQAKAYWFIREIANSL